VRWAGTARVAGALAIAGLAAACSTASNHDESYTPSALKADVRAYERAVSKGDASAAVRFWPHECRLGPAAMARLILAADRAPVPPSKRVQGTVEVRKTGAGRAQARWRVADPGSGASTGTTGWSTWRYGDGRWTFAPDECPAGSKPAGTSVPGS
jgi:hypothetical protein